MTAGPAILLLPVLLVGALVVLAVTLRAAERAFPAFSRWLDRRFGEEPGPGRPW